MDLNTHLEINLNKAKIPLLDQGNIILNKWTKQVKFRKIILILVLLKAHKDNKLLKDYQHLVNMILKILLNITNLI